MVGVLPRGKHSPAASRKHQMSLEGVGLGRAGRFLGPSTLPDPSLDNRNLLGVGGHISHEVAPPLPWR